MFQTPRLEQAPDGGILVSRWGRIAGRLLRVGDRLILGNQAGDELLVLVPRGYGRPMLGRCGKGGLIAEPSGVPASGLRWQVAGSVLAVERDLERGGVGAGTSHVVCRVEGGDLVTLARARSLFFDGTRTERELIHLCSQAAVAPGEMGVRVAIAAASDRASAEALLASVAVGSIRFALPVLQAEPETHGLVVPGPWQARPAAGQKQFEYMYDVPENLSSGVEVAEEPESPQLSLFGQRETA